MQDNGKLVYTAKELSEQLGIALNSVYRGLSTGEIPSISVGRRKLIPKVAIDRWLDEAGNKPQRQG